MRKVVVPLLAFLVLTSCVCAPRPRCCRPCSPRSTIVTSALPQPAAAPVPTAPAYAAKGEETTWDFLRGKYDRDGDGRVDSTEYRRDKASFARLDANEDGVLTSQDFDRPSRMHVMIAQMYLMFFFRADDEPDTMDLAELEAGFSEHDANGDGKVTEEELVLRRKALLEGGAPSPMPPDFDPFPPMVGVLDRDGDRAFSLDELTRFFAARDGDEDGVWRKPGRKEPRKPTGPEPGSLAPDFSLRPPGGGDAVRLSAFAGKRPVALIFGSWT